jgi:predicted unusual protein kinase regulating ubiquinone biosynthesis (AarF/ABC1/UbiB family)
VFLLFCSQDEAKERRKAILSNIGEDLLLAANDQPFRFPATFTFVVRSFTVLDGIGKSLDPRCVRCCCFASLGCILLLYCGRVVLVPAPR